ncbi:MAG TPA: GNAT family N-acetyltransferase [Bellilinea sp.]|nr:GNAT family N-acetyltransferase [Bellilinea sp.]
MNPDTLTLTTLRPDMRDALIDYAAEFSAAGEPRHAHITVEMTQEEYTELLRKQKANSQGEHLPPGRVPETVFFLVRDGSYVIGSSRLRHTLTPSLENEGGHIGYDIRPLQRGKGYATLLLNLVLEEARRLGLSRVLVTCDETNIASARVIEKNGGKLIDKVAAEEGGQLVRRYWIEL